MTQRRVENTRVHFGSNSPVSVKENFDTKNFSSFRLNFIKKFLIRMRRKSSEGIILGF